MQREKENVRVDRAKTCPFLIRVFYADNAHHQYVTATCFISVTECSFIQFRSQDFDGKVPLSEVQVHTWFVLSYLLTHAFP
jgi:hypothetical protein